MIDTTARTIGARVSYGDVANPRRVGTVIDTDTSAWGTQYVVRWDHAPEGPHSWSDLRQAGWQLEAPAALELDVEPFTSQLLIPVPGQLELAL